MSIISKIFGNDNEKYLKKTRSVVEKINSLEQQVEKLEDLKKKPEDMAEAFALVREASKRTLNQRHYDVQLIAGLVLNEGKIAEMKTGEGKTLASTLAIYWNALEKKGVHVITVNDYLSRRDTVWMGQIYHSLGLSVGCLNHDQSFLYDPDFKHTDEEKDKLRDEQGSFHIVEDFLKPCSKKQAYAADITYGTNNEFGFDYLRDNLASSKEEMTQRGFHYAIIDEIDSVLIDESRTPLIISAPDTESSKWYKDFARIIPRLSKQDYEIDEKMKAVTLTEAGIERIEKILGMQNIYQEKGIRYLHHLEQALRAQALNPADKKPLFSRDRDYVVKDGQVIIVDEFTGRLMPGRRWSGGLHQAIEAKERVEVRPESKTLASITFQNYFRMYEKLAGMTGTAITSQEELNKVYGLEVIVIPTNKPVKRNDMTDLVYKTEMGKYKAIVEEVRERHSKGQPVLIGTNSIEKNELLAKMLQRQGIKCEVLNAKQHEREGEIIAQAGKKAQVTVATNMAGRGVDIVLGGNPGDPEEVKSLGGLHVIGCQRHEARRIDDQLRGRGGRQGDPGSSQFFISLQDELLRIFGGDRIESLMQVLKLPEDQPIEAKMLSGAIEKAQKRVEGRNFDIRAHVLEYDDVISKHRNRVYHNRKDILSKDYIGLKEYVLGILEKEIQATNDLEEVKTIMPLPNEATHDTQYLKEILHKLFQLREEQQSKEDMEKVLRFVCLKTIDMYWTEHLSAMDSLRDSVRLRAYGGKDPLVEYKTEGHKMFQQLQGMIDYQISRTVFKLSVNK